MSVVTLKYRLSIIQVLHSTNFACGFIQLCNKFMDCYTTRLRLSCCLIEDGLAR